MTSDTRPLAGPAIGSAWEPARAGRPRPLDSGTFALVALPSSPLWARQYAAPSWIPAGGNEYGNSRETAELLVSELVTTEVEMSGSLSG
jgi:hypothetical protein